MLVNSQMSANPISQLVHSTVRLTCVGSDGSEWSGSGYIFLFLEDGTLSIPCVVSNKHVLRGAQKVSFSLTLKDVDGKPLMGQHELVTVNGAANFLIDHPDRNVDLAALLIGPSLNEHLGSGKNYYFVSLNKSSIPDKSLLDSLSPMESIIMIGYPNGIWDAAHNLPIIRQGITATHPNIRLNNKPEFLIDAACFPGSSGSPVFLANIGSYMSQSGSTCLGSRICLLGTLYAGPQHTTTGDVVVVEVPTATKSISRGTIPNNLGYVIQAAEILKLEDQIKKRQQPTAKIDRNSPCTCGSGKRFKHCCGTLA